MPLTVGQNHGGLKVMASFQLRSLVVCLLDTWALTTHTHCQVPSCSCLSPLGDSSDSAELGKEQSFSPGLCWSVAAVAEGCLGGMAAAEWLCVRRGRGQL